MGRGGGGTLQATVRLAAGSVYFVRLGSGEAGRLGMSWAGRGVASLAIVWLFVLSNTRCYCTLPTRACRWPEALARFTCLAW